jgi:heme A synthase
MTRRLAWLAWTAAASTYLLIVLGAIVRITGSGLGCGDSWPLCRGQLFPPLDDIGTVIEWSHRLSAALVSGLVVALASYAWWLDRRLAPGTWGLARKRSCVALALLVVQVGLGAVTVKLQLPPWTVILHLATAMVLLATLIVTARGPMRAPVTPAGRVALALGFVTVLLGALTANLGAAAACLGFPLCNGQIVPDGNYLQRVHWIHRLLAYSLLAYGLWWAGRTKAGAAWRVVALLGGQVAVGAAMVLWGLPRPIQAVHVAVGAAVWAGLVLAVL